MFYTIYKITNLVNGKIYIGAHQTENLNDGYMGSGNYIKRAIAKHGKESFTHEILFFCDNQEEMYAKEAELVDIQIVKNPNYYNIKEGGRGFTSEVAKIGRIKANEAMLKRYGEDYVKITTAKAKAQSDIVLKEKYGDNFLHHHAMRMVEAYNEWRGNNPDEFKAIIKLGCVAAQSVEAKHKKKETMKRNNHSQGTNNSQFGTMWITNPILKENKKINKADDIPEGWYRGRVVKF